MGEVAIPRELFPNDNGGFPYHLLAAQQHDDDHPQQQQQVLSKAQEKQLQEAVKYMAAIQHPRTLQNQTHYSLGFQNKPRLVSCPWFLYLPKLKKHDYHIQHPNVIQLSPVTLMALL